MKKLLLLVFSFSLLTASIYGDDSKRFILILDAQTKKQIGKMSIRQFETLVKSSERYKDLLNAENEKRIKILIKEEILLILDP